VGAAAGGLVVAAYGVRAGYTVEAASFFIAAVLVGLIRRPTSRPREPHVEHPGLIMATHEAMAYARKDRRVLVLFAARLGMGTAVGLVALLPVIAIDVLHAGDRGTGILFAFRGVGFLIGPFFIRSVIKRRDRRRLYALVVAGPAAFAILFSITPWMLTVLTAGAILLAGNMVLGAQWVLTTFAYQSIVPDRLLGRIFGFDGSFLTVTIAASNAIAGVLAGVLGVRWAAAIITSAVVAWSIVVWLLSRGVRRGSVDLPAMPPPGGPVPGESSHPAI